MSLIISFVPTSLGYTLFAIIVSGFVFILTRWSSSKPKGGLNLPPGPPGWPVVGNLFQFARSGKSFFEYAEELKQKYGGILTVRMGTRTMIILSDANLVHEALIKRGALFATRPAESPTRTIFSCDKFTVNAAKYGPVWRSLRRNMVQNMLSSTRLKEFGSLRQSSMDKLIERIKSEAREHKGLIWVLRNARFAAFCILLEMCFGIVMDEASIDKMDEIMKTVLMTVDPRIDDYLPILAPFFSKERKRALEVRREQVDYVVGVIERRRRAIQNPGSDKTASSFSYLDTLFDLTIEGRETTPSNEELVTLCSEFLNGGTDTTGTAIEWGIAQLIANPEIQSRLYDEIKSTVGDDRSVEEKDVDKMVYLQAFVKELLRKHPPTYFSLTHAVTETTTLGGYDIPAGVNVEVYLPGMSEDPRIWSNPKKFDPDRFMLGKENADITGITGVKMIPFGVGRRICPGLAMATVHVHLMLARMVQEFEWSAYPSGSEIDFAGKTEFTVVMKNPLRAKVKPRI
ncbi:PREDICTED: cytochrome P450 77A4-like [Camelina sativa]|uniref:Cytochrome P450 77A4-like n=1 Tax=Camelina sativa TaxID=90675 RepID=A0ABM0V820_CAMSA|nr:PREDICTED: cytochrome P450 77A4-like [Camelina sativa]